MRPSRVWGSGIFSKVWTTIDYTDSWSKYCPAAINALANSASSPMFCTTSVRECGSVVCQPNIFRGITPQKITMEPKIIMLCRCVCFSKEPFSGSILIFSGCVVNFFNHQSKLQAKLPPCWLHLDPSQGQWPEEYSRQRVQRPSPNLTDWVWNQTLVVDVKMIKHYD